MSLRTVWLATNGDLLVVGPFGAEWTPKYMNGKGYDLSYNHKYWPYYKKFLRLHGYLELGSLNG